MPHVQKRKITETITQTVEVRHHKNKSMPESFSQYFDFTNLIHNIWFDQSTQSNQHRPHKKLRITAKRSTNNAGPSIQVLSQLLETTTNSNESLQILTQISDTLANSTTEDIIESIRKLREHFKREKESAVRVKVSRII